MYIFKYLSLENNLINMMMIMTTKMMKMTMMIMKFLLVSL